MDFMVDHPSSKIMHEEHARPVLSLGTHLQLKATIKKRKQSRVIRRYEEI